VEEAWRCLRSCSLQVRLAPGREGSLGDQDNEAEGDTAALEVPWESLPCRACALCPGITGGVGRVVRPWLPIGHGENLGTIQERTWAWLP
jgi:hypothetical protein